MTPSKVINTLFGKPCTKSFPTEEDYATLPKLPNGQPDQSKMPHETVANVVLSCLSQYPIQGREDTFKIYTIGSLVVSAKEGETVELKPKLKEILLKILDWATINEKSETETMPGKQKSGSFYYSWVIAQVLADIGEAPAEPVSAS